MNSAHFQIQNRINKAEPGYVFAHSDFLDLAKGDTVRQSLHRLAKEGIVNYVINGIYFKPRYSEYLGKFMSPNPNKVAEAIARSRGWTIAIGSDTALNMLGLSTQVPACYEFVSDGPNREYKIGNCLIEFNHRPSRELKGLSPTTSLVVQALRGIGKKDLKKNMLDKISAQLTEDEKKALVKEGTFSIQWVYEALKEIAEMVNENE